MADHFSSSATTPMPPPPRPSPLLKQMSWSPESDRDEVWLRRQGIHRDRRRDGKLTRSVTDEDLDELRGCIDLGFGFEDAAVGSRLSDTFPALDLYYAVNRQYAEVVAPSPSAERSATSSAGSSPLSLYSPGESPQQVKARLKQWAQVVACSVRQHC